MQIGMRQISPETADWFGAACAQGRLSRSALARELCLREDWRGHGGPCLASARRMLPRLAERLGVSLPAPVAAFGPAAALPDFPDSRVRCPLRDLGALSLELAETPPERRRWEAMVARRHPQGGGRPPGGQVLYWLRSETCGILGGVGFGAAGMQLGPRDRAIGWSADARTAGIGMVVCSHRFLILPGVRVHGLASAALRLATGRVADDWETAYGVRPVLAQTFTGLDRSGLCYRAAGWKACPELTSGRRRAVWLKPLAEGWRQTLCLEPQRPLGHSKPLRRGDGDGWARREYGRCPHPDGRVRRRVAEMGAAWLRRLGEPVPAIFPGRAEQAAAYRLLSNPGVTMEHVLESHCEATVERCRVEPLVLAVQDTTTLSYDGLSATGGLDSPGGGGKGSCGILAHAGVAVNGAGRPLGLFMADAGFRRAGGSDSVRWVDGLKRARQLAQACPDSRVVTVCDREGDFWELLGEARATGAELLVRASRSVRRRVALPSGAAACLWEHVLGTEPVGCRKVEVPACGGPNRRRGRTARLTLRCVEVDLLPPKDREGDAPLRVTAVSALEETPPRRSGGKRRKALHWMLLLAAEGPACLDTALTALRWYELRWRVERFFHALKNGTRIEDRRLDHADDLRRCLAFDAITAFRVWDLSLLARERPDDPASLHVAAASIRALRVMASHHGFRVPRGPPEMTVSRFVTLAGGLAGFHPSKRQPLPGTAKLWEGLRILMVAVTAIQASQEWNGKPVREENAGSQV